MLHLSLSFYKTEIYLQEKSIYQSQIEDLFKGNIILKDDFCANKYSDYIYHYTDAESALSILVDKAIYPYLMKSNLESFGNQKCVLLTEIEPDKKDDDIQNSVHYPKLHKLQYAFGFKKDFFENNLAKLDNINSTYIWKYDGKIELKKQFILVIRKYQF